MFPLFDVGEALVLNRSWKTQNRRQLHLGCRSVRRGLEHYRCQIRGLGEASRCTACLLDPAPTSRSMPSSAYELYKLILGPVEERIAKKPHLLQMVMNGALTSLPIRC